VITVGSFHAGTKHNIIPDEAHLQLTVRTMNPQHRAKVLASIARITNGIAAAAGVPRERSPIIEIAQDNVPATINNPELTRRVAGALERSLGKENVLPGQPAMASEDFSLFALEDPSLHLHVLARRLGSPKTAGGQRKGRTAARPSLQRIRSRARANDSSRCHCHDQRGPGRSKK